MPELVLACVVELLWQGLGRRAQAQVGERATELLVDGVLAHPVPLIRSA